MKYLFIVIFLTGCTTIDNSEGVTATTNVFLFGDRAVDCLEKDDVR